MRALSFALGFAGLALATCLIGWFGADKIIRALLTVGPLGFAAVCGWQMLLFALLGLCWFILLPAQGSWRLPVLIWGRMVRDAAGGLLPLSLVGGFVLGARAVTLRGVSWPIATASTLVDLTTEFLAQIGLVLIGVFILAQRTPGAPVMLPVLAGLAAASFAGGGFLWLQRGGTAPLLRLSRWLLGDRATWAGAPVAAIHAAIGVIYAAPARVAAGVALHLLAWGGTGVASFIAFRLLGARIDLAGALGIEALLHAVLAMAILVPGYAGVQELAYAAVGALFDQPADIALGVSLLRRARDVALGVPILLVWQMMEVRRRRAA